MACSLCNYALLFVLLSLALGQCTATPSPPDLITRFTSSLTISPSNQKGRVWYDGPQKQKKYFVSAPYYAAPQYPLNITVYELGSSEWQVVNEQCRVMGSGFSDWFSWVSLSTFSKTVEVAGRLCDEFDLPSGDLVLHMDVEQGTGIPVQYYITQGSSLVISYLFGPDLTEEFSNSAFNLTKLCTINDGHGFYCGPGPVIELPMFRYHSATDYSLANKNTADLLGDTAYLCAAIWTKPPSQVVSLFSVQVNSTWGQYGLCNDNECVGGALGTVGHASMGNLHAFSGQCKSNNDTGNWYSMDEMNECSSSDEVQYPCAWKVVERVKSVGAQCLLDNGLKRMCLADQHVPYERATALIQKAFETDMCPDVPPPE